MIPRMHRVLLALLAFITFLQVAQAAGKTSDYVTYTTPAGDTELLLDDRKPSLYTGNFGDCLGTSQINVTRFDAAYYKDNMTVLFHLEGNSGLKNSSIMMYIGVFAYGESRFDLIFNPCTANINSLCPVNSSIPIEASGIIPVSDEDVSAIPPIALSIPDFEGQAVLRLFDNLTQSEIGCYSAVVTNGATFSHPSSVGTVLGIFTIVALVASFVTAAYGEAVPTMRLHYAHSLSVGVVFAVFQHIFFTGALSANWPSVLVAWWSNFAWSGGMIPSQTMQSSINKLIGNNVGNISQVGAAAAGSNQDSVAGGVDLSLIYKRALIGANSVTEHPITRDIVSEIYKERSYPGILKRDIIQRTVESTFQKRQLADASTGYTWYGHPVEKGLPLPGNYSGFAGTLATQEIRASNAFMTGFLWFLIILAILVAALMAFKWALEGLAHFKVVKQERFKFFRDHWLGYSAALALRTCYIAFFAMMFLTMFQFTYESSGGVKAIAAIVFIIFVVGIFGLAAFAIFVKRRADSHQNKSQKLQFERKTLLGKIPWFGIKSATPAEGEETQQSPEKKDDKDLYAKDPDHTGQVAHQPSIHDDEEFTMKFGWLASRFRRTRWWFFAAWVFYEFVRAIFYAGASGYPLAQIFGLLVVEFLAFVFIVVMRPFEGRRLNLLVVYCLGFSKVASVALAAAFDPRFNLERITTTVIGIVIIVIQGILTILTLIAIVVGAFSSYMSVSRNYETFKPKSWEGMREKYFNHLDRVVEDVPRVKVPKKKVDKNAPPPEPNFQVKGTRRVGKIEDDDTEYPTEVQGYYHPNASFMGTDRAPPSRAGAASVKQNRTSGGATPVGRSRAGSRAASIKSQSNLPFGARPHRASWSTHDFQDYGYSMSPTDMGRDEIAEGEAGPSNRPNARHSRNSSRRETIQQEAQTSRDNISIGGEVSTRDSIGKVPMPSMRPRASTFGSRASSRCGTPPPPDDDSVPDLPENSRIRQLTHGKHPLTPAQENDEFNFSSPKSSQDKKRSPKRSQEK